MDRLENVATPDDADTVPGADSAPPPGLVPIATVTLAVELVTVFPNVSWTATCTAGETFTPAVELLGWPEKASLDAAAGLMLKALEVAPVSGADAAVSV